jgi:hypothetical protein
MKTILVYDPAMCCSTGICGPNVDPDLVNFAGMLSQLGSMGVKVKRHNLAQSPLEFAINPRVKEALAKDGTAVLPLIFWDGELHMQGRYPTHDERPAWFKAAKGDQP